jgi:PAS domain-containing protein
MLTLRRAAALTKLGTLQKRAERVSGPSTPVVANALHELSDALEEVQVATEQLQTQVDDLAAVRQQLNELQAQFTEYIDIVPVPTVWTDVDGGIQLANAPAADLLNVSAARLVGRPLALFLTERGPFAEALAAMKAGLTTMIEIPAVVRPRERRPRELRMIGRRLRADGRTCWFLTPPAAGPEQS